MLDWGSNCSGELIGGTFAFLWPRKKQEKGEKIFIAGRSMTLR
jgi:hypothetical protein